MPIARFEMPDGRVARFEVPDGTSPEQAQSMMEAHFKPQESATPVKQTIGKEGFGDALRETLRETDWGTRNVAGAGTALSDIYQGAKQFVGLGDEQAIEANKIIADEAPLGAFAGNAALTAIPFGMAGKSVKTAGVIGGGFGALQPVQGEQTIPNVVKGKLINTAFGTVFGAGGQAATNKVTDAGARKLVALSAQKSRNVPIDETIKKALDAGYVFPPGQIKPTFINRRLESAGGKQATQQMASNINQDVTDSLARRAAGLADDSPINPDTLKAARDVIKKPYEEIANLGLQKRLDELDAARHEATAAWREYSRQGTRSALNDYKRFNGDARNIEAEIENRLFKSGHPDLMKSFREARVALAKNHDVETALIEGGGSVDARTIARMFQRGNKMTDELRTIGSFANNFPKVIQPDKMVGTPAAHNLPHVLGALLTGAGGAGAGVPGALAGFAAGEAIGNGVPAAARSIMFSKPMQNRLINSYSLGVPTRTLADLMKYAPVGGTVAGLQTLGQ